MKREDGGPPNERGWPPGQDQSNYLPAGDPAHLGWTHALHSPRIDTDHSPRNPGERFHVEPLKGTGAVSLK